MTNQTQPTGVEDRNSHGDMLERWVLLWSQRQNAFHIEPLARMLDANRKAFAEDRSSDYVVLELGNREVVDAAADALRPVIHARETAAAVLAGIAQTRPSEPSA
ncbi:hypothetical protein [Variovorax guangxiensis]|uniref:hypothetical protein n=1 Tax=Variovorax guangxiensis TaxID=1775474 RepID=UPI00197FD0AE|nr:hypothetical protein [Variovorax guangxiensis]